MTSVMHAPVFTRCRVLVLCTVHVGRDLLVSTLWPFKEGPSRLPTPSVQARQSSAAPSRQATLPSQQTSINPRADALAYSALPPTARV